MAFSLAADKTGHPLVFEPEAGPADEALAWNLMTWGQYRFPFTPLIDKYKWLEPRHMVNISDRWNRDKTSDLQFAFFNGVGWELGEHLGYLEWNYATRRRGDTKGRHDRAGLGPIPGQQGLGTDGAHAALWSLFQPMAAGG